MWWGGWTWGVVRDGEMLWNWGFVLGEILVCQVGVVWACL